MTQNKEAQIRNAEELLRKAMLNSDVDSLDQLLAPNLIFTNHLGHILGKQDNLDAHRSKLLSITNISVIEQKILLLKDSAIVSEKVEITGNYNSMPANGTFRFTRIWQCLADNNAPNKCSSHENFSNEYWQVVAAHSSVVA